VEANYLFFGADVSSRGGFALSNNLRATTFPFFAVIYIVQSQVNVVARLEGTSVLDLDSLLVRLIDVHENTSPQLVAQQFEDSERDLSRRQIEEQDKAYKEALEKDRKIAEERKRKEEEAIRVKQEAERKQREKEDKLNRIKRDRVTMRENLAPEPQASGADMRKQGISLVKFKLPDGSQVQRKFNKEDKVIKMYEFIHVLDASLNSSWTPNEKSDVTDYELSLNFPKRILEPEKTLAESDCFPNAQVFVREDIADDEEDEIQLAP
jgi:FAS-associated factor 2